MSKDTPTNSAANAADVQDTAAQESVAAPAGVDKARRALMIGAAASSVVLTIRPALAQTAGSVLNCEIPVPDSANAGRYIAPDGSLVDGGTAGAFPGMGRPFTGEEVKDALNGRSLPGTSYEQSQAYLNYIRRLQYGQSGFTCYASLQMPR